MFGLEKEHLGKVENHLSKFSKVLKNCLNVKNEEILVIGDYGFSANKLALMLSYGYYQAAIEKGLKANILLQEAKKGFMFAEDNVNQALKLLKKNSVIILSLSNKLGKIGPADKSFRAFCRENSHRFVSATGLGGINPAKLDLFMEAVNVNYRRMKKEGLKLKNKLDRASQIRVKTDKGTDFVVNVENQQAVVNVGDYEKPGEGGNLPAGEVYIPPVGFEGVNGKIVIDGSMRCDEGTKLLNEPLTLTVEKGKVIKIEGFYKGLLERTLCHCEDRASFPERVRYIGEFGIGINPGAVLMGSSILDEKVLGTAHIAIGSNYWFGGKIKTILHLDQVFLNPKIYLDDKELKL